MTIGRLGGDAVVARIGDRDAVLGKPDRHRGLRDPARGSRGGGRDGRLPADRPRRVEPRAGAVPRGGQQTAMPTGLAVAAITTAGYAGILVGPPASASWPASAACPWHSGCWRR